MMKFCAYQERCQSEVRTKLYQLNVYQNDLENIICELIEQNFLNEERFAQLFCRGKFYQKGWGKIKIINQLKSKQVSDYCINKGLLEIDEKDYLKQCENWIEKKKKELSIKEPNEYILNNKVAAYTVSKGFESELVWELINN